MGCHGKTWTGVKFVPKGAKTALKHSAPGGSCRKTFMGSVYFSPKWLLELKMNILNMNRKISFSLFPARKCPSCPSPILPTCSGNGIGFREKCFHFVENETNWNESQNVCLSLGAQLATIDSEEDLGFLLRYGRALHYWVGLHQEGSDPWRWCNGSLFNNRFDIQGNGQCAYIDLAGVSSDWCSQQKYLVCSHPLKSPRGA
uniref:C-type lectin domain-containing protein n=1 Tax=Anas platyrhynchos platyrhynchos TaxID=8840 RepID=A0A493TG05_ANAPP